MSRRLMATVIVKGVDFKGMSVYGIPSYWVEFEPKYSLSELRDRKGYTASNAQCGYSASNFIGKECRIEYHYTRKGALIINTMEERCFNMSNINKMKELAGIFGLELGEEFNIMRDGKYSEYNPHVFTEDGLVDKDGDGAPFTTYLLRGLLTI